MLHIVTFHWGDKYGPEYVERLAAGVARHVHQPHKFEILAPHPSDEHLTKIPGCFARLRLFDPFWQFIQGLDGSDDRIVCMDLDTVITGPLDPLFRPEPFLILQGANSANPCPYNGSLWALKPGYRPDVWADFSIEAAQRIPAHSFPDDQGWMAHKLPGAAGWKAGEGGVYAMGKPGWPKGTDLPADARIVVFPGWRDPAKFAHLPWVKEHWR